MKKLLILATIMMLTSTAAIASAPPWDGYVHAPLKTAQSYDWSAPDQFFTGYESANVKYLYTNDTFEGTLELTGFKQAGPYVLTVDTNDGSTLAGYGCDIWTSWANVLGETFAGGTNGCWGGNPYVDVKLFTLEQYDSDNDGVLDYYRGSIPFDVPLLVGTYDLKFFVKLDWHLTSPYANIMMMNDMIGMGKYGKVTQPKNFDYDEDLVISDGLAAEKLVLADNAWCVGITWLGGCDPPSEDPGYQGTMGVVFYQKVSDSFRGTVILSNTVTPPTPQPLQIKLEGMGSLSADAESNEWLGYIGRWWDNTNETNLSSDAQYEANKASYDILGYAIFDGFNTALTSKAFALDSSYHTLWTPQPGRPATGSVVMTAGNYKATFALTENERWWRGVFLSEHPLEFTIVQP